MPNADGSLTPGELEEYHRLQQENAARRNEILTGPPSSANPTQRKNAQYLDRQENPQYYTPSGARARPPSGTTWEQWRSGAGATPGEVEDVRGQPNAYGTHPYNTRGQGPSRTYLNQTLRDITLDVRRRSPEYFSSSASGRMKKIPPQFDTFEDWYLSGQQPPAGGRRPGQPNAPATTDGRATAPAWTDLDRDQKQELKVRQPWLFGSSASRSPLQPPIGMTFDEWQRSTAGRRSGTPLISRTQRNSVETGRRRNALDAFNAAEREERIKFPGRFGLDGYGPRLSRDKGGYGPETPLRPRPNVPTPAEMKERRRQMQLQAPKPTAMPGAGLIERVGEALGRVTGFFGVGQPIPRNRMLLPPGRPVKAPPGYVQIKAAPKTPAAAAFERANLLPKGGWSGFWRAQAHQLTHPWEIPGDLARNVSDIVAGMREYDLRGRGFVPRAEAPPGMPPPGKDPTKPPGRAIVPPRPVRRPPAAPRQVARTPARLPWKAPRPSALAMAELGFRPIGTEIPTGMPFNMEWQEDETPPRYIAPGADRRFFTDWLPPTLGNAVVDGRFVRVGQAELDRFPYRALPNGEIWPSPDGALTLVNPRHQRLDATGRLVDPYHNLKSQSLTAPGLTKLKSSGTTRVTLTAPGEEEPERRREPDYWVPRTLPFVDVPSATETQQRLADFFAAYNGAWKPADAYTQGPPPKAKKASKKAPTQELATAFMTGAALRPTVKKQRKRRPLAVDVYIPSAGAKGGVDVDSLDDAMSGLYQSVKAARHGKTNRALARVNELLHGIACKEDEAAKAEGDLPSLTGDTRKTNVGKIRTGFGGPIEGDPWNNIVAQTYDQEEALKLPHEIREPDYYNVGGMYGTDQDPWPYIQWESQQQQNRVDAREAHMQGGHAVDAFAQRLPEGLANIPWAGETDRTGANAQIRPRVQNINVPTIGAGGSHPVQSQPQIPAGFTSTPNIRQPFGEGANVPLTAGQMSAFPTGTPIPSWAGDLPVPDYGNVTNPAMVTAAGTPPGYAPPNPAMQNGPVYANPAAAQATAMDASPAPTQRGGLGTIGTVGTGGGGSTPSATAGPALVGTRRPLTSEGNTRVNLTPPATPEDAMPAWWPRNEVQIEVPRENTYEQRMKQFYPPGTYMDRNERRALAEQYGEAAGYAPDSPWSRYWDYLEKIPEQERHHAVAQLTPEQRQALMEVYLIEHPNQQIGQRIESGGAKAEESPYVVMGGQIKAVAGQPGRFYGQLIRWGSPDECDLSQCRDWFHKGTDLALNSYKADDGSPAWLPLFYHHAMDPKTTDAPRVGWVKVWTEADGAWLVGELDKSTKYWERVQRLIDEGKAHLSTDSAPHLIQRTPAAKSTNRVDRFPVLGASVTPSPAEFRLPPVEWAS